MDELSSEVKPGIITGDLEAFFASLLREAARRQRLSPSPFAFDYVSNLFVRFADADVLFSQEGVSLPVLADMMHEARDADVYRRISILRRLGDTSLMISGYFPEALNRRNVDVRYYVQMGEVAYAQLDDLSDTGSVYGELSAQFINFSELIQDVSVEIRTIDSRPEELLEMYSTSRSPGILKKLQSKGIFPISPKKENE